MVSPTQTDLKEGDVVYADPIGRGLDTYTIASLTVANGRDCVMLRAEPGRMSIGPIPLELVSLAS